MVIFYFGNFGKNKWPSFILHTHVRRGKKRCFLLLLRPLLKKIGVLLLLGDRRPSQNEIDRFKFIIFPKDPFLLLIEERKRAEGGEKSRVFFYWKRPKLYLKHIYGTTHKHGACRLLGFRGFFMPNLSIKKISQPGEEFQSRAARAIWTDRHTD